MSKANEPPENWAPSGETRGCATAAAAIGGVALTIPLMVVAINIAEGSSPWPGIVLSALVVLVAIVAFSRPAWPGRAFALGLTITWAALSITTGGSCTGFQPFNLYA